MQKYKGKIMPARRHSGYAYVNVTQNVRVM